MSVLGPVLGAVGSIAGSIFGGNKAEKAAEANIAYQKQFAKQGIRWRVRDAEKAGIHPLAALGAQTHSFTPVNMQVPDYGASFGQMGQGIGDAFTAMQPTAVAQRKQDQAMAALALERAKLENDLLKVRIGSQIRTALQPGRGPGVVGPQGPGTSPQDPTPSTLWFVGPDGKPYPAASPQFPDPEQDIYRQYKEETLLEDNLPHIRRQILKAPADFLQPLMDFIIPYLPDPIDWSTPPARDNRRGRNAPRS